LVESGGVKGVTRKWGPGIRLKKFGKNNLEGTQRGKKRKQDQLKKKSLDAFSQRRKGARSPRKDRFTSWKIR